MWEILFMEVSCVNFHFALSMNVYTIKTPNLFIS